MTSQALATVVAHLEALLRDFKSGAKVPSEAEVTCAAYVLRNPGVPTDVLLEGIRLAGVDVAPPGGVFAPAVVHSAGLLRTSAAMDSAEGQRLIALLHDVMSAVLTAPRKVAGSS
ncbi:hypothetical protein [Streptomyces sp. NBC_01304]|uniref:hypothetical protein n=1 Tax=Streptomyces sp. NBC_01304 TaxID=2903818 RepID=UPI002E0DBF5F|nr:hypothetical protein OG430_47765 [Streptomyces sp. NBC_01304]